MVIIIILSYILIFILGVHFGIEYNTYVIEKILQEEINNIKKIMEEEKDNDK